MNLSQPGFEAQTATGFCEDPGIALHATKYGNNYAPGSKVRYQCQSGYRHASGQLVIKCLSNITWSGHPPECKGMSTHISAAIIGCVMGFFLVLVVVLLPVDFCLFKRRKMAIAERRNARKRDRSKGRPSPFLTYHSMTSAPNSLTFTKWEEGHPVPSDQHVEQYHLLQPPSGKNGLLEPLVADDNDSQNAGVTKSKKGLPFHESNHVDKPTKNPTKFSYLRKKKRVAPSMDVADDYQDENEGQHSIQSNGCTDDYDDDDVIAETNPTFTAYTYMSAKEINTNCDSLESSTSRYYQEKEMPTANHKQMNNLSSSSGKQEIFSTGDHKIHSYPPYNNHDHRGQTAEGLKGGAVLYGNSYYV